MCNAGDGPVTMTFDEIEQLVGSLPESATKYSAWWANQPGSGRHEQATTGSTPGAGGAVDDALVGGDRQDWL